MHNPLGLGAGPQNPLGECSVCKKPYIETNGLHSAPSIMAVEYETADFLYGLVRMLKPKVVLETGCGEGHSTFAMSRGVQANNLGHINTCDTEYSLVHAIASTVGPIDDITCVRMEGVDLCRRISEVDLAFLDSSGDRVAECAALKLSPKGVVVLHDSKREQYRPIWTMRPWKTIWEIDTPRGLTVFAL